MKKIINLQHIFALMFTHSNLAKYAIRNEGDISKYFVLSEENTKQIKAFLQNNQNKILPAAKLLEEKRRREMLPCMTYTAKVLNDNVLKIYWQRYLSNYPFTIAIPPTPILDAISFLGYLKNEVKEDLKLNAIIEYDIYINRALNYQFKNNEACPTKLELDKLPASKLILNPSLTIKKFNLSVTKLTSSLNKQIPYSSKNLLSKESIGFYKDFTTHKIKGILMNEKIYTLIQDISNKLILPDSFNNSSISHFYEKLLKQLIQYNLIWMFPQE